jgi:hypothetical protein
LKRQSWKKLPRGHPGQGNMPVVILGAVQDSCCTAVQLKFGWTLGLAHGTCRCIIRRRTHMPCRILRNENAMAFPTLWDAGPDMYISGADKKPLHAVGSGLADQKLFQEHTPRASKRSMPQRCYFVTLLTPSLLRIISNTLDLRRH